MTTHLPSAPRSVVTPPRARLRAVLRWLPSFLGFPLGGLAAMLLIGPVTGVGSALAGGLVTGAILGAVQALALARTGRAILAWTVGTWLGLAVGLAIGGAVVGFATDPASLALQGAISGAGVGVGQAVLLRDRLPLALAWPAVLAAAWAIGWLVTTAVGVEVQRGFTVFGASGALTVTVLTAALPALLVGRRS
jgi:hypothetical protein